MTSNTAQRKRKRDETEDGGSGQVSIAVHDGDAGAIGPVLVSFPATQPPASTKFGAYQSRAAASNADFASKSFIVAGASNSVEYYTSTETQTGVRGCRYYIGVRNKKTNVLTIRQAPVHILARRVKGLDDAATLSSVGSQWMQQRNELGEIFGTKKAQKAIRAAEKRKIDVSAMEGVTDHIQESIETNTKLLPTQDETKAIAQSGRPLPPHNVDGSTPQEAYPLEGIIPTAEFNALPSLTRGSAFEETIGFFPSSNSEYVRQRLRAIMSAPKPDKQKYKILLYIACLLTFRHGGHRFAENKEELQNRMRKVPLAIVDGIVSRFTETSRGSTKPVHTHDNGLLLLAHLFVLCLHLDDFAVDTEIIASDLRESVTKINQQFKVLGCKVETLSSSEMSRRGIPATQAQNKYAILRVPLQFPNPRIGKRR